MKKKIHFHSDCSFFAGCENMLAVLFNSEKIHQLYSVSFSYAQSDLYKEGFKSRVLKELPIYGFTFPALTDYYKLPNWIPLIIRKTIMASLRLLLHIPLIIYEIIILYILFIKIKPHILHINNGGYPGARSALAATFAGRLAGVPNVIMVVNNMAVGYWHYSRWLDYIIDYIVAKSMDLFITGSLAAADRLKSVLVLPDHKIISLHNGISVRIGAETISETRNRLGLNSFNGVIFGVVSLLIPRKGHIVLLNSVLDICRNNVHASSLFKVLIEGSGPLRDELILFVKTNKLNDVVQFIDNEKNIVDFMSIIDVLILPSIYDEDFPNVVIEAMSLGKPVIASRLAGVPEQLDDGKTGFMIEPGNVEQLANAITTICADKSKMVTMGDAAHCKYIKFFTADVAIKNYVNLYESLLRGGAL